MNRLALGILTLLLAACGGDEPVPLFPADYATSYVEVRACRTSADHDLSRIRVLTDVTALNAYVGRNAGFPAGSIVLTEEYALADAACAGPIVRWSALERLAGAEPTARLGWRWQQVDPDRVVVSQDEPRCTTCHVTCSAPPDGYLGTCAAP